MVGLVEPIELAACASSHDDVGSQAALEQVRCPMCWLRQPGPEHEDEIGRSKTRRAGIDRFVDRKVGVRHWRHHALGEPVGSSRQDWQ